MYTYDSITRNGVTTILPNTYVDYDWKLDKYDVLKDLDTKVIIKGVERYVFQYRKNGTTIIKVKDITTGAITQETRSGFVPVTVTTEGDEVKVTY